MKKSDVSRSFKSAYDPVDDPGFSTVGDSLTQQHMADGCDINKIVPRYQSTGVIDHVAAFKAQYGDFVGLPDYLRSFHLIDDSMALFDDLPADVRERFNNDPGDFLQFANNPDNESEMIKLGLLPPPSYPEASEAPVENKKPKKEASPKPSEPSDGV